jgi:hypothetical protein
MEKVQILVMGRSIEQARWMAIDTFCDIFKTIPWHRFNTRFMENDQVFITIGSLRNMEVIRGRRFDKVIIDHAVNPEQMEVIKSCTIGPSRVLYFD